MTYKRRTYQRADAGYSNFTNLADLQQRYTYFSALAKGLEAGLTPIQCLRSADLNAHNKTLIDHAELINAIQNGASLSNTFSKYRLASDFDISLMRVGETSGRLADTIEAIAERYKKRIERRRILKSKLVLPLSIIPFAIVVAPIPRLLAGTLSLERYLLALVIIGVILFGGWLTIHKWFARRTNLTVGYPAHPFIAAPIIGDFLLQLSRTNFLERFHLLLRSGIPLIEAIELAHESLVGFSRRHRYKDVSQYLLRGATLADAFEQYEILSAEQLPILVTGEAAGRLEESLGHIASTARAGLDRYVDQFLTWVPRLLYFVVIVIVAGIII